MHDYRRLKVWRDAHLLTKEIYRLSDRFPKEERYGVIAQLRRAAVSVPANIAEGAGRRTNADFGRFLDIAAGSSNEVEYYLLLAADLGWIDRNNRGRLLGRIREIRRELIGLRSTLKPS